MWELLYHLKEERRSLGGAAERQKLRGKLIFGQRETFSKYCFLGFDFWNLSTMFIEVFSHFAICNISFGAEQMRICTVHVSMFLVQVMKQAEMKSWNRLKTVSCSCKELRLALETLNMKSDGQMVTYTWPRLRKSKLALCGEWHCWCGDDGGERCSHPVDICTWFHTGPEKKSLALFFLTIIK